MKKIHVKAQAVPPVRQHFVIFHTKCWWVFTGEISILRKSKGNFEK